MTRTFLVAIELPNDADINAEADEISFILSDEYTVSTFSASCMSLRSVG